MVQQNFLNQQVVLISPLYLTNKKSFLSFDFHFILKYFSFSFLPEILLNLNIIIVYIFLLFTYHDLKINKSRYIALFVVSGSIKTFFSIDYVNV